MSIMFSKHKNEIIPFNMFKKMTTSPKKVLKKRKNDKTGKIPKFKCINIKDKETMAKRENKDKK